MSKIDQLVKTIVKAIDEKDRKKTQALDTVATVSRIDGDTAWVKFAGSDSETPVKQTIAVKKGDKVQVRASKGSAWITGNITSPPTDNTLAEEAVKKSDTATKRAKRAEDMSIVADVMYYLASDQDEGVTTEDEGWTQEPQEATVALPYLWCYHEYTRGNGTKFNSDPVIISRYTEGGAGVQSITTYYALGTSTSTAPTSGWATTFSFRSGYYIWRKELINLTDGTTTWSQPVYDGGLTEACELAFDAAQYIWTQPSASATTSVPSGQYVTEVDKDSYRASPTGGAVLIRSAGMYIRYAAQTVAEFLSSGLKLYEYGDTSYPLAQFLSSGAVIGKTNSTNLQIDSSGINFYSSSSKKGHIKANTNDIQLFYVNGLSGITLGSGQTSIYGGGGYGVIKITNSGVTVGDTNQLPLTVTGKLTAGNIDCGDDSFSAVANGSYGDKAVTFNKTFPSAPEVAVTMKVGSGTTAANIGSSIMAVISTSTTGFTVRYFNNSGASKTVSFTWIAIGS